VEPQAARRDGCWGIVRLLVSVLGALGAAMSFAWAAILQQEAAQGVSPQKSLTFGLLVDLLNRPKWLVGVTFLVAGYGLQLVALVHGPVALVQPIVMTELAFAIPCATWRRRRTAGRREWMGIACVLGGVLTFLLAASPRSGAADPTGLAWLLALVLVGSVITGVLLVASRAHEARRAMLLGASAGLAFGVLAALTKAFTHLVGDNLSHALASWQPYAIVLVGISALVLSQSAYQAGPLAYSMPTVGVLEPTVAVVIGATVLGEQVRVSATALTVELGAAVVAAVGICLLATSPVVRTIYETDQRRQPVA
jgi:drug/metabolite transporter (DMT)-like permease